MKIQGFRKLTLLDYPGKLACIVFVPGCNLRCPWCHNAELAYGRNYANDEPVDEKEIFSHLNKRYGLLEGLVITGGEPLMQDGIREFVRKVCEHGYSVKLDTNGTNPVRLKELLDEELLDYVAVDVKNVPERYGETVGRQEIDISPVFDCIRMLAASGIQFECRTTVVNELHTPEGVGRIAELIAGLGAKRYFLQNFRESDGVTGEGLLYNPVKWDDLIRMRDEAARYLPETTIRNL